MAGEVVNGLLRRELGFDGVAVTDALDMGALDGRRGRVGQTVAAGVDLLLCSADEASLKSTQVSLEKAYRTLAPGAAAASRARIERLRRTLLGTPRPGLDVVGCADHRRLAQEVAHRSITLVRNGANLLPFRLEPRGRILAVMPRPSDLTPADTSSWEAPQLAAALRRHHPNVTEAVISPIPTGNEMAAVINQAPSHDVIVIGTINAGSEQAALVEGLIGSGVPTVTAALRLPTDLAAYPSSQTHLCTYSIVAPSLEALASVLFGADRPGGRLPMAIGDLVPFGAGG